ncbi:MAG TPA: hypothetical protein VGA16_01055 [Candidatus Limnocylindria bacterium]
MRDAARRLVRVGASLVLAALLLAGSFSFVRWWDLTLPSIGHATYQAVFLSNGQVFFGRYYDRIGPYVKIVSPYYIQQTGDPSDATKPAESRIVRRGDELHAPLPEMLVPRTSLLFVEDLSAGSAVAQFIAKDRP